ncbi:ethanolaminephosphotransferase 1-like isoform X1 [Acipenser oxyrinchus oxyrinchus]|uniref:Ethanolaminephosphotransferase 1 n=1 Tax=Acipenser oxyrinchus oxyrinchus TaxID=40147 RepID=A0AAD8GFV2_ACIOX|nr:ethanolaminephosphotransferase 1-like isoform X1 [Acipenser oxyrinchus oxyrinchus]
MLNYQYVTPQQLAGFEKYKYSAVDTNPLSVYVMQHLWNWIVKIVPLWIAPNLLTFTGFLMILLNYFLLSYYDWNFTASAPGGIHAPNWVWGLSGFATFSAYALDSIDGKHARRTQSSSPLGELFDHGLDSWATSLFTLSLFSVFGLAAEREVTAYTLYSILCVILLTFLLSHWEKYNTGVLYLPWGYDISQITLTAVYLLSAVVGVEAWYRPLPFGYFFTDILIAMVIGCCAFLSLPQTLYNIYQARKNKTLERNSTYEGLLPLASPALLFALLTAWVKVSADDILTKHPRLFLWMVGVTFSNVTCRLIICQMTNTRSEVFHWLLLPLAAIVSAVSTGLLVQSELILLVGYTVLVTIAHVHYGLCVGKQLSKHLNIFIFSLEKRHQE